MGRLPTARGRRDYVSPARYASGLRRTQIHPRCARRPGRLYVAINHYSSLSQQALEGFDKIGLSDETINPRFPRTPKTEREFFLYCIANGEDETTPSMSDNFLRLERAFWRGRRRPSLLLVHYDDLKADLSGEMKRVAEFLEITRHRTRYGRSSSKQRRSRR